jgi:hypothetical protein
VARKELRSRFINILSPLSCCFKSFRLNDIINDVIQIPMEAALIVKYYLLFWSNCQEKFTTLRRDRGDIISDPSLGRGQGRRIRGFWGPMGARYPSTGRMRRPGRDRAFSSQVVTLGGSENATRRAEAFSSQVATLGGSEKTFRVAFNAFRMNECEREPHQGTRETTMKPRISRRALTGAALGLLGAPALVRAQDTFPNRPITLVVPSPAGGGTDFSARLIADQLGRALGGSMVVENRPGRGCAGRQNHRRLSFSARAMRPFTVT